MPSGVAYGCRWSGFRTPISHLGLHDSHGEIASSVAVDQIPLTGVVPDMSIGETRAALPLVDGGWAEMELAPATLRFHLPRPVPERDLVHPYLAGPAAVFARWAGRMALHAGAFVVDGRAWGVLGDSGAGKSTLLAALAANGVDVLTDDVLVLDGSLALSGPSMIDLVPAAADALDVVGEPARGRTRTRVMIPAQVSSAELAGWVVLSGGDEISVLRVPPSERARRLLTSKSVVPTDPSSVFDLVAKPMLELVRPPSWDVYPDAVRVLIDQVEGHQY